jgi:hypothetical protein
MYGIDEMQKPSAQIAHQANLQPFAGSKAQEAGSVLQCALDPARDGK